MHREVKQFFNKMADGWDSKEIKETGWLSDFLNKYVPIREGMRVLDLGCGTGIISGIIYEMTKTKVIGLDISNNMIELAKVKHVNQDINFYSEDYYMTEHTGFDMVLCFNAYPHFVDVESFKNKTLEILNDSGYCVVLHNLSRKELSECHSGLSENISRDLLSIDEELKWYQNDFDIVNLVDNDEMFMMLLQKKRKI